MTDRPAKTKFSTIYDHRVRTDKHLIRSCEVSGTALGSKVVAGSDTSIPCYTVFVRKKKARSQLKGNVTEIPETVTLNGIKIPTDVIEISDEIESQDFNLRSAIGVQDRKHRGTVTCFARKHDDVFVVSCAHVLQGPDLQLHTRDPIDLWSEAHRKWVEVGESAALVKDTGSDTGDIRTFGIVDAGIARLKHLELVAVAKAKSSLPTYRPRNDHRALQALVGKAVIGQGSRTGRHVAEIKNVWVRDFRNSGLNIDVIIGRPDGQGMTKKGDSGFLWYLQDGRALAVHCLGLKGSRGSPISLCMFSHRAAQSLGVRFIEH